MHLADSIGTHRSAKFPTQVKYVNASSTRDVCEFFVDKLNGEKLTGEPPREHDASRHVHETLVTSICAA